jgi:hypothetical protein
MGIEEPQAIRAGGKVRVAVACEIRTVVIADGFATSEASSVAGIRADDGHGWPLGTARQTRVGL